MSEPGRTARSKFAYARPRLRGDVLVYETLDSTNTTLRAMAAAGVSEGRVVIADRQTAGRGRHGRSWNSPAGAGFYGSVLLRPNLPVARGQLLTLVCAVAVAETLLALGATETEIKWPNDVLIANRKVCGILVEVSCIEQRVDAAIAGIGVNLRREAVPEDLAQRATSLEDAGIVITNIDIAQPLLTAIDRWYTTLLSDGDRAILTRWMELAPMARDSQVTVDDGNEVFEATTLGITPEGLLRVRRDSGAERVIAAGEVTLGGAR